MPRLAVLACLAFLAAGCESGTLVENLVGPDDPLPTAPLVSTAHDPARCGQVTGRVTWPGPIPLRETFLFGMPKGDGNIDIRFMPGPNYPDITPESRAGAGAVVFLRGVDLAAARPWDLPAVRVEMKDRQIQVHQGDGGPRRVGFVRRGDPVSMKAAEPLFHILRGRGAVYFSYTFPEPDHPLTRSFDRVGRIELSSGAGYYWANADLFVDDHPYYTLTDRDGRFTLDRVPAGEVEVVVWLPGWLPGKQERDPESGLIVRMGYSPPTEVVRRVVVEAGRPVDVTVSVP